MVGRNYHWVQVFRRLSPAAIACSLLTYAGFLAPRTDMASILTASGSASALLLISTAVRSWVLPVKVAGYRQSLRRRPVAATGTFPARLVFKDRICLRGKPSCM
jgi:hypothetical protein